MLNIPLRIVLGILGLVLAYAMLGTDRYWILHDRSTVAHLGEVKVPDGWGDPLQMLYDQGVHLRREPSKAERIWTLYKAARGFPPAVASYEGMSKPALGYSVREIGFFGMPFGFYREYGHALYVRNGWATVYLPLDADAIADLDKLNGRDVTRGIYPYWQHLWGWLFVLGLAFAGWLWHRGNVRRRELLGLID